MEDAIGVTIGFVVFVPLLVAMLGKDGARVFFWWFAQWVCLIAAGLGWFIIVVAHFLGKYW